MERLPLPARSWSSLPAASPFLGPSRSNVPAKNKTTARATKTEAVTLIVFFEKSQRLLDEVVVAMPVLCLLDPVCVRR